MGYSKENFRGKSTLFFGQKLDSKRAAAVIIPRLYVEGLKLGFGKIRTLKLLDFYQNSRGMLFIGAACLGSLVWGMMVKKLPRALLLTSPGSTKEQVMETPVPSFCTGNQVLLSDVSILEVVGCTGSVLNQALNLRIQHYRLVGLY